MSKLKPTGRYVEYAESFTATQLFGKYHAEQSQENKTTLNNFLQSLGVKYGYNWTKHQIAPDGEIIEVIEE